MVLKRIISAPLHAIRGDDPLGVGGGGAQTNGFGATSIRK